MRPPFEIWAPQEIANLRAEADALQRTLDRYLGQPSVAPGRVDAAQIVHVQADSPPAKVAMRAKAGGRAPQGVGRPTKHSLILDIVDQAGPTGLTIDEIERASVRLGHPIKRNSLRSFLWTQRGLGQLFSQDGRNVASKFKVEGEPEVSPSSSPDLLEGAV